MKKGHLLLIFVSLLLFLSNSCLPLNKIKRNNQDLKDSILKNEIFSKAFTGFVLYDPVNSRELVNISGNKSFIPASNTKIATLLACLEILGDSLSILQFALKEDSLFFKGTANPLNLSPYFVDNKYLIEFLAKRDQKLFYVPENPPLIHYGSGWAWDDFNYYYQLENNDLPIYGNELKYRFRNDTLKLYPDYWEDSIEVFMNSKSSYHLRNPHSNEFEIHLSGEEISSSIPVHLSDSLTINLLSYHLNEKIEIRNDFDKLIWRTYNIPFPDSLLIRLMQESDNFLAEQLIIMASAKLCDSLNRFHAIEYCKSSWNNFLPDTMRWVDGSGLSRYNLFTPMNNIKLLERIVQLKGMQWIRNIFPKGGEKGTIRNWYGPFVFAKTGSLSNNHNLSGYLFTKSNKMLIFSFMHNHFLDTSRSYKDEMEIILEWIHANY